MYPTTVILLVEMSKHQAQHTLRMADMPTLPMPQASVRSSMRRAAGATIIIVDGDTNERRGVVWYSRATEVTEPPAAMLSTRTSEPARVLPV